MKRLLAECRERVKNPPRNFDREELKKHQLGVPLLPRILFRLGLLEDPIIRMAKDHGFLLENGRVIWGYVVFANPSLYQQVVRRPLQLI